MHTHIPLLPYFASMQMFRAWKDPLPIFVVCVCVCVCVNIYVYMYT